MGLSISPHTHTTHVRSSTPEALPQIPTLCVSLETQSPTPGGSRLGVEHTGAITRVCRLSSPHLCSSTHDAHKTPIDAPLQTDTYTHTQTIQVRGARSSLPSWTPFGITKPSGWGRRINTLRRWQPYVGRSCHQQRWRSQHPCWGTGRATLAIWMLLTRPTTPCCSHCALSSTGAAQTTTWPIGTPRSASHDAITLRVWCGGR